jgi:hypothetical protein
MQHRNLLMTYLCRLWRSPWRLGLIGLALLLVMGGEPLWAHGGGTPRLIDVAAGPYRIFAWTLPEPMRVGEVHVTIGLTANGASAVGATDQLVQPVTDATVLVHFVPVAGDVAPIVRTATLSGVGAVYYEADASLPTAEEWRVMIEVQGAAGTATAEFAEVLLPARTVNRSLLIAGSVAFLFLIAFIGIWNRQRAAADAHAERRGTQVAAAKKASSQSST